MSSWISAVSSPNRNSASVLASSVLPDAGRAQVDERAAGTLGVLEAGSRAPDGLADRPDGVFLADDPLVQLVLHAQELLRLFLGELVDGDARPQREHLGDGLFVDLVEQVDARVLDLALLGLLAGQELLLGVAEAAGLFEVLRLDGLLLRLDDAGELVLEVLVVGRGLHAADAQPAAGLVDEVDGLVGQEPVADVAVGEVGRGDERLVGDGDPVVGLVAVAQALQDLDRVGHRGLVDRDLLEAALEGGVLLEVLAVLVERRGADGLQLAPGQHRLEDRGGVDGALGGPRPDERVDLVDEQDDVAAGADLLEHLLQALLEVAPVAAARHQRTQVEGVELLVVQRLGDVVGHDRLGQALDDRRLADAGLAHQHRVVLGAAGEDLHDPLHLAGAADDGVELLLAGELGEVAAELVEDQRAGGLVLGGAAARRGARLLGPGTARALVARQELDDLLADPREVGAQLDQHLGRDALALADEAEEDVLGADVVVAELQRLAQRQLEDLLGAGRERDVPRGRRAALADDLLDLLAYGLEADAQRLERLGRDTLTLVDEAEQDVLGADVVVVEEPGFLLGQDHDPSRPVGEPFEQETCLPPVGGSVGKLYSPGTTTRPPPG